MMQPDLILATDLDGTFLGGPPAARRQLYHVLQERPAGARLIFVTGRGLETVLPLLSDPALPRPDYVIADVGATVVRLPDLEPVQPLQSTIARRWPGTHRVLDALASFGTLTRQDVPQERRCSFYSDPDAYAALAPAIRALGCDVLFSAGRYLDVLPAGVNKGSTLLALCEQEGFDPGAVVVAGDTLNDLSMYREPFAGIVVGQAELALTEAVRGKPRVYEAEREGAGGILEGLLHHGMIRDDAALTARSKRIAPGHGAAKLVMVYHRLPFDELREQGGTTRRKPKSPNGIIPTLLGFFQNGDPGAWVAWSLQESRAPEGFEPRVPVDAERYPGVTAARIALTAEDVDLFYHRFSKEAFWPVIFSFTEKAEFDHAHWEHYVEVNRIFAERAAHEAAEGGLVWIHDYNLWLVPAHLRRLRPDVKIAFFHHTAFPSPDIFNILPWRREILASLLCCDYVGFHIPRYVENFVEAVRAFAPARVTERVSCAPRFLTYGCALGVDTMTQAMEVGGRVVRTGAHPVGIDLGYLEATLQTERARARRQHIQEELAGRRCVLSIERLDYVKGPIEKLLAFEKLLERHPDLHGKVVLFNVVTPAAAGMEVYDAIREEIDRVVGRINGRFSRLDWIPVRYFFRALPYEEVLAAYAASDVAWITPLRDGLNLVAKEYVAAKGATQTPGVLILSEFAGAACELQGALLTNPYDPTDLEAVLYRALTLDPAERVDRMRRLVGIVRSNDVQRWGRGFLDAVRGEPDAPPPTALA